MTNNPERL